jgi:hypothetical protein
MNPLFVVLIYGNNSPNMARNYCNILILVVTDRYHNDQNLCGEKQLRQYNRFMVKCLLQQRQILWHQGVITIDNIFVARTYCDITNIHGERTIATKLYLVAPDGYPNVQNICGMKQLRQYRLMQPKRIHAFSYIIQTMVTM